MEGRKCTGSWGERREGKGKESGRGFERIEEEGRREGMVKVMEEWKRCKGRGEEKGKMVASTLHGETFKHAEDFRPSLIRWLC